MQSISSKISKSFLTSITIFHLIIIWSITNNILYNKQCSFYTLLIDVCLTVLVQLFWSDINGRKLKMWLILSSAITYAVNYKQQKINPQLYWLAYLYIVKYYEIWEKLQEIKQQYFETLIRCKIGKLYDAFVYSLVFVMGSKILGLFLRLMQVHLLPNNEIHQLIFNAIYRVLPEPINTVFIANLLMYGFYTVTIYLFISLYNSQKQLNSKQFKQRKSQLQQSKTPKVSSKKQQTPSKTQTKPKKK